MTTAKEWLLSQGLIKEIKQGRISKVNHDLLAQAVAGGLTLSDYKPAVAVRKDGSVSHVNAAKPAGEDHLAELFYRYDLLTHKAVDGHGTEYSLREACQGCGYSLVGHLCDSPVVTSPDGRFSIPVSIVKR